MEIPGLDLDKIVETIISVRHQSVLDGIEDDTERKAKERELIDYYTSGSTGAVLKREIKRITKALETVEQTLVCLQASITLLPIPPTIPQVIVGGGATGVPNPAWAEPFIAAVKQSILSTCYMMEFLLLDVENACESIDFAIPEIVETFKTNVNTYKISINAL